MKKILLMILLLLGSSLNGAGKWHELYDPINILTRPLHALAQCHVDRLQNKHIMTLSHLGECLADNCPLSRLVNKTPRNIHAQMIVEIVCEKIQTIRDRPVVYASFASGELFHDLRILIKILLFNPRARLDVHFIDLIYNKPIHTVTLMQLIHYLQDHFPNAQLSYTLHKSSQDYMEKNKPADVISIADLEGGAPTEDYLNLCEWNLKKNIHSKNLLIGRTASGIIFLLEQLSPLQCLLSGETDRLKIIGYRLPDAARKIYEQYQKN